MRVLAALCLGLVLGAVLALVLRPQPPPPAASAPAAAVTSTQHVVGPVRVVRTNIIVQVQSFSWRQVESPDYFQYVANLRAIGCPEATIRDIIVADVNQLYARRRATLVTTEYDLWWRSEPDLDNLAESAAKLEALDAERRTLLTQLLGPNWEDPLRLAETRASGRGPKLTGPVLSQLPEPTERAVRDAWDKYQRAYAEWKRDPAKAANPLALAHVQRQYREELERALTPEQLEEYLLRNSRLAEQLRENLAGFGTTPDEFRAIFRARDNAERQTMWATVTSAEAYERARQEQEKQAEAAIERALGPERYREYKFNLDPAFRSARAFAEEYGAPAEAVLPIYELRKTIAAEEASIRSNPLLTADERVAALKLAREQTEAAMRQIIGNAAYERYAKAVEQGEK